MPKALPVSEVDTHTDDDDDDGAYSVEKDGGCSSLVKEALVSSNRKLCKRLTHDSSRC